MLDATADGLRPSSREDSNLVQRDKLQPSSRNGRHEALNHLKENTFAIPLLEEK